MYKVGAKMTFLEFNKKFSAEKAVINYFYRVRYNGKLTCPHCGAKVNLYQINRQKVCICPFDKTRFHLLPTSYSENRKLP
jgi:hypothetical protein